MATSALFTESSSARTSSRSSGLVRYGRRLRSQESLHLPMAGIRTQDNDTRDVGGGGVVPVGQ